MRRAPRPERRPRRVVLAGNIGAGKSTVIDALRAAGVPSVPEPLEEWRGALGRFYADPRAGALALQLRILRSYARIGGRELELIAPGSPGVVVYERGPSDARAVFVARAAGLGFIDEAGLRAYDGAAARLAWEPDAVLYLRSDPEACAERVRGRARDCESGLSAEDLAGIHELYERWFETLRCRRAVVDAEAPRDEVAAAALAALCKLYPDELPMAPIFVNDVSTNGFARDLCL